MKIKTLLSASLCSLFTNIHAGTMGPVSSTIGSTIVPFVSIEGAYIWNSVYPGQINGFQSERNDYPWGGRVGGGFTLKRSDNLRFSGELGWGSYGHNAFSLTEGESASYYYNGFDILLGAIYSYQQVDFFAKFGAMNENTQANVNTDLSKFYPGGLYTGHEGRSWTDTAVLPEIKIGGEYNFNNNLAVSLAYMYVFGSNLSVLVDNHAEAGVITFNQQIRAQAPTFNTIMLGLRYYI